MARVTVRSFAALRELVGPPHEREAASVAALVAQLRAEHGDELDRRLARSTIAVDDEQVRADDDRPLRDGAEVVLLPPFAGG